jgi:hypothetical protein
VPVSRPGSPLVPPRAWEAVGGGEAGIDFVVGFIERGKGWGVRRGWAAATVGVGSLAVYRIGWLALHGIKGGICM